MADDPELASIRSRRMEEMQQMQQMQGQQNKQEEMAAQQEMAVNGILNQVLDQAARTRLNTICVVKPEKGKKLESFIVQMARNGQVGGKLSENDLVGLLERINAQSAKNTTVKFDRRRAAMDSDSD